MWSKYLKEFQILYERVSERERKKVEEGEKPRAADTRPASCN